MKTDGDIDLAEWLRKEQEGMGITYVDGTSDEQMRMALFQLCRAEVQRDVQVVTYWGYRERKAEGGKVERVTLRALNSTVTLPDGTRYLLQLIGPYDTTEGGKGD